MKINSSRNSLLRARNLRSARRSRVGHILGSRTSKTNSSSRSGSTKRTTSSTTSSTAKIKQLAMYEKVEKAADDIQGSVKKMLAIGKMTYTDDEAGKKAQENDKENLFKNIKEFVSDFNTVRDELTDIGGVANLALRKTLDSIVSTYTSDLKDIGITVLKSGEISLDEKALEKADFDKVKALFTGDGGFAEKISVKMETIEKAAADSVNTLNKLYGATSTYNRYGTSNSYLNSGYNNYNYNNYGNNSSWYF